MPDYIIVGAGLSGIAVAEELIKRGRSIKVFDNSSQSSSTVAGGLYNPVILKRFTLAWEADKQLEISLPFYRSLEKKLKTSFVHPLPVFRKFNSVEEQNNWFTAMDKASVAPFLDHRLTTDINPCIPSMFQFGRVRNTGAIDTEKLLLEYRLYLKKIRSYKPEKFNYEDLQVRENNVKYNEVEAKAVIFCEGFGLKDNPFFNHLPLQGNKGEYIIIKSDELKLEVAVKSSVFILPLGKNLYKVGATYDNLDKTPHPTSGAKEKLLKQLKEMITCNFEVVDQVAGIRPATRDRRPLAGRHPQFPSLYCCNGFGSRGVLIAPVLARDLVEFIHSAKPLSPEVDLNRFTPGKS